MYILSTLIGRINEWFQMVIVCRECLIMLGCGEGGLIDWSGCSKGRASTWCGLGCILGWLVSHMIILLESIHVHLFPFLFLLKGSSRVLLLSFLFIIYSLPNIIFYILDLIYNYIFYYYIYILLTTNSSL